MPPSKTIIARGFLFEGGRWQSMSVCRAASVHSWYETKASSVQEYTENNSFLENDLQLYRILDSTQSPVESHRSMHQSPDWVRIEDAGCVSVWFIEANIEHSRVQSEVAQQLLDVEVSTKSQNMSCCFWFFDVETKGPKSFVLHPPESSKHVETIRLSLGSQHSSSLYCCTQRSRSSPAWAVERVPLLFRHQHSPV